MWPAAEGHAESCCMKTLPESPHLKAKISPEPSSNALAQLVGLPSTDLGSDFNIITEPRGLGEFCWIFFLPGFCFCLFDFLFLYVPFCFCCYLGFIFIFGFVVDLFSLVSTTVFLDFFDIFMWVSTVSRLQFL